MKEKQLMLMLGDLVGVKCVDGSTFNIKVTSINELLVEGVSVPDHKFSSWGYYTDLSPIPLTAEILQNNGFASSGSTYVLSDDFFDILVFELSDSIWQLQYNDTEFGVDDAKMNFCYVHQLQQIMRLCGIEKEIEI